MWSQGFNIIRCDDIHIHTCSIDRSMAKIDAFTATSVSSELLLLGSYVYFIILIC